jgi:hypothetical protein
MPRTGLAFALAKDTGISTSKIMAMLDDLTYGVGAKQRRIQPMHCSLFELTDDDKLMMLPHSFCVSDGLVNLLRVVAQRDPKHFQSVVSPALDEGFQRLVYQQFQEAGFKCYEHVDLRPFDKSLPDIDLLVSSTELTLGYFIYVCELKGLIPPQWSKDHLRALDRGSIPKAFTQLDRIMKFLNSSTGIGFLRSKLPAEGLPHYAEEFLILATPLIITSNNAGMFFGDKAHIIINYRSLDLLLRRSDGDVTYVNHYLKNSARLIDEALETVIVDFKVGNRTVHYEVVTSGRNLDFPQNTFKSQGIDIQIAQDFIEDGHHPYDALRKFLNDLEERNDL